MVQRLVAERQHVVCGPVRVALEVVPVPGPCPLAKRGVVQVRFPHRALVVQGPVAGVEVCGYEVVPREVEGEVLEVRVAAPVRAATYRVGLPVPYRRIARPVVPPPEKPGVAQGVEVGAEDFLEIGVTGRRVADLFQAFVVVQAVGPGIVVPHSRQVRDTEGVEDLLGFQVLRFFSAVGDVTRNQGELDLVSILVGVDPVDRLPQPLRSVSLIPHRG